MCGISGFIDFSNQLNYDDLVNMTDVLNKRGPDSSGYIIFNSQDSKIGLGHRRLSIIDTSLGGSQPMSKHNRHIIFNGEIYNYQEIKKELEVYNYTFVSGSDTEVILSAYDKWGIDAVNKFNGMFAFALFCEKEQKVILCRDRAGVKPLYYYWKEGIFLYSSELKSFHEIQSWEKKLNLNALQCYFQFGNVSSNYCIYENCYKLEQGHYIDFDIIAKSFKKVEYWNVFNFIDSDKIKIDEVEIIDETEKLLISASNYRMIADVPVGVFLSSGYDSSLVTALLQKERTERLKTFTIGFEYSKFNEVPYAKAIANYLGTDHSEFFCTEKDAKDIIPILPEIYDEPFADSSAIPTVLVSKYARQSVKVALSADGGDEQFVGYSRYINSIKIAKLMNIVPSTLLSIMGSLIIKSVSTENSIKHKIGQILAENKLVSIPYYQKQVLLKSDMVELFFDNPVISKEFQNINNINCIFAEEYQSYLQDDILVKVDRASMYHSLEAREPFLDYRLAEWSMKLPIDIKYKNNELKYILKKISRKYISSTLLDRPKQGFAIPIDIWLRNDLNFLVKHFLDKERLQKQGLFKYKFIEKHLLNFYSNTSLQSNTFIWQMLVFQLWYEKWMS